MMICEDAGPSYALNMNWETQSTETFEAEAGSVFLIDPRLSPKEYSLISEKIKTKKESLFGILVTDPGYRVLKAPLWKFIQQVINEKNVFFLSKYHPFEATSDLFTKVGSKRFFTLPYPYIKEKEINYTEGGRKRKIIFSGNINKEIYPERFSFWLRSRRSLLRLMVDTLHHPGYPDVGHKLAHNLIATDYLQFLSNYMFMFLSGSPGNLELLKYNECIYAGCAPFGFPPDTYPKEIADCFYRLDPKRATISTFKAVSSSITEIQDRRSKLKDWLLLHRSPSYLNQILTDYLSVSFEFSNNG